MDSAASRHLSLTPVTLSAAVEYKVNAKVVDALKTYQTTLFERECKNFISVDLAEIPKEDKALSEKEESKSAIHTIAKGPDDFKKRQSDKAKAITIPLDNFLAQFSAKSSRFLIAGIPGVGKTTLSWNIAYQWATSEHWQKKFIYMFRLPLRELEKEEYQKSELSFAKFIHQECLLRGDRNKIKLDDIKTILEQEDQVLIILDGWDEVAHHLAKPDSSIANLLEEMLSFKNLILTSRPYYTEKVEKLKIQAFHKKFESLGFTDPQVEIYIKNCCSEATVQQLQSLFKENPVVFGAAHTPLHLQLICELYTDNQEILNDCLTTTDLYQRILSHKLKIYTKTQNIFDKNLEQKVEKELRYLEKIAFLGMKEHKAILAPDLLQKAFADTIETKDNKQTDQDFFDIVLKVGYLNKYGSGIEIQKPHYFIHLTFQYFFAARYLCESLKLEKTDKNRFQAAVEFIRHNKYNRLFSETFEFMAGLLNPDVCADHIWTLFWELLQSAPLDLAGFAHVELMMNCLQQVKCHEKILKQYPDLLINIKDFLCGGFSKLFLKEKLPRLVVKNALVFTQPEIMKKVIPALALGEFSSYWRSTKNTVRSIILYGQKKIKLSIISYLEKLMFDSKKWEVQSYSAYALRQIPEITTKLINQAKNNSVPDEQILAIYLLIEQEDASDNVVAAFLDFLKIQSIPEHQKLVIGALHNLYIINEDAEKVVEDIVSRAETKEEIKKIGRDYLRYVDSINNPPTPPSPTPDDYEEPQSHSKSIIDKETPEMIIKKIAEKNAEQKYQKSLTELERRLLNKKIFSFYLSMKREYITVNIKGRDQTVLKEEYDKFLIEKYNEDIYFYEDLKKFEDQKISILLKNEKYLISTPMERLVETYLYKSNRLWMQVITQRALCYRIPILFLETGIGIYTEQDGFIPISLDKNIALGFAKAFVSEIKELGLPVKSYEQCWQPNHFTKHMRLQLAEESYRPMLNSLFAGDVDDFINRLRNFIEVAVSTHDFLYEADYHAFMLGLTSSVAHTHIYASNKEAGLGRPDKLFIPKDYSKDLGVILEYKASAKERHESRGKGKKAASESKETKSKKRKREELEVREEEIIKLAEIGLAQIDHSHYQVAFSQYPYIKKVLKIGIAFSGKLVAAAYQTTTFKTTSAPESSTEIFKTEPSMNVSQNKAKRLKTFAVESKGDSKPSAGAVGSMDLSDDSDSETASRGNGLPKLSNVKSTHFASGGAGGSSSAGAGSGSYQSVERKAQGNKKGS